MNAWVITWEGTDRSITDENKLVAIFRADYQTKFVRRLIRILYLTSISNGSDMAKVAYRPRSWPSEQNWGGKLWCGHVQKGIYARTVSDLKVVSEARRQWETVSWKEPDDVRQRPPKYKLEFTPGRRKRLRRRSNIVLAEGWAVR